ncbi:MAG: hypothetical protein Kow0062_12160 [Acidobacteriota bacterium]
MSLEIRVIRDPHELESARDALDALAPARGRHADIYDTASWLLAWLAARGEAAGAMRVLVAERDGRPVAMLPLAASSRSAWTLAGSGLRPRFRPVIGVPEPGPAEADALGALVERATAEGMRALDLPALPSDDPASALLVEALRRAGFRVGLRAASADTLAEVDGEPWDAFRRRFRKFERTVKNFTNKASRLGEVSVRWWGGPSGGGIEEGFERYRAMHALGWKGPLGEPMARHRRDLLARAAVRGWARVSCLEVAGVPAAAMIWFRLGEREIAYSTVYDVRLAALSAGTILIWRGLERAFDAGAPQVVDFLPGRGSQKDQLCTARPPLHTVEAVRSVPHAVGRAVARGARAVARRLRPERAAGAGGNAVRDRPATERVRAEPAPGVAVRPLEIDPRVELYLVVAGGHRSPKQMREGWGENDRWLVLGDPAAAFVRLDGGDAPRELVLLGEDVSVEQAAALLAAALGRTLDDDLVVHRAILPAPDDRGAG